MEFFLIPMAQLVCCDGFLELEEDNSANVIHIDLVPLLDAVAVLSLRECRDIC